MCSGRSCLAGCRRRSLIVMLGRVKTKDILSLARSRIDGANVLATLHFPNRCHYSILLNGVIGDVFQRGFSHRTLACRIGRALNRRGLILRHFYGNTPLKLLRLSCWFKELLHTARASVHQTGKPSERCGPSTSSARRQRNLDCPARSNHAPTLSFDFDTGHSFRRINQNSLHLRWSQGGVCLQHAGGD
jgi:hypothetical protein